MTGCISWFVCFSIDITCCCVRKFCMLILLSLVWDHLCFSLSCLSFSNSCCIFCYVWSSSSSIVFFTLRCLQFFIFPCHLFFFINPCVFSYYISFLLPDEAFWRNVVNSTVCCPSVCCSSVCCSLNYYTAILSVIHKCGIFFSVAHFCAANVVFLRASMLSSAASTLPSVEAPTFVLFLIFFYWVLSLSYFSHFAVSYFTYFAVTFFSS